MKHNGAAHNFWSKNHFVCASTSKKPLDLYNTMPHLTMILWCAPPKLPLFYVSPY